MEGTGEVPGVGDGGQVGVLGRDLQEPRKYSSGRGGYSLYEELLWLLGLKYKMVKCLLFDSHRHLLYSL